MRALSASFFGLLRTLRSSLMLFFILPVPLICALALYFLVPIAERFLIGWFHLPALLAPYYLTFDLLAISMPPFMLAYVSIMVVLEERDDGLTRYLAITPLGRSGYVLSRVGAPILVGTVYSVPLLALFSLTRPPLWLICLLALIGGLSGAIAALLVPALAENKVEGMAMVKLSSLLLLGLCVPFFVSGPIRYLAAPLPAFWMAELAISGQGWYLLPALAVSALWLWALWRRFSRKMI